MHNIFYSFRFGLIFTLALGLCSAQAQTAKFPEKPVKLVVSYPVGGSTDLMARLMGQKMSEIWGQPVIIESKVGASGSIGMEYAARQPNDGYTFVMGNLQSATVNPLMSKVPYVIDKDFAAVAITAMGPNILVVPANSPYKNLNDVIADAKANPNKVSYGTSGAGSVSHLAGELISRQAGIKMVGVPYKGGGQAITDVISGQLHIMVSDALPASQHIKSGRLRALAITSEKRSALFPEIPTFAEAGLDGIVALNWWGIFLPAGTPQSVIDNYNATLAKIAINPELKDRFNGLGVEPHASSSNEFKALMASEKNKYLKLISDNNIKVE